MDIYDVKGRKRQNSFLYDRFIEYSYRTALNSTIKLQ